MARSHSMWVVYLSVGLTVLLHLVPLPFEWRVYRPPLVEMTLFYWVLALPHRMGVISSASLGLVLDVVEGGVVGAQSLGLVASALILLLNYQRIRQFDLLQQSITMAMLVVTAQTIERWIYNLVATPVSGSAVILSLISVPVLWPVWRSSLRALRREWRIA